MQGRRILLVAAAAIVLATLAGGGAYLGVHLPDWTGGELEAARAGIADLQRDLDEAGAHIEELREQRDTQQVIITDLVDRLTAREREVGTLQSALALSGPLTDQYNTMATELGSLKAEHTALEQDYASLQAEMSSLIRIQTPELPGNALLLDRSVRGVTYTGSVCSGSMEPNISCDDLLILYSPAVTDLEVGDIIYFRRPAADCSGPMDGRFMLHRIVEVTAGSEGLAFRTKGDALEDADFCPVPATDVLYKLLTNIRNARIADG